MGKFRTTWNVPYVLGALDDKHLTMKKLKKSGSDYCTYKGFLSLMLLAQTTNSCGDIVGQVVFHQIFNFREKIEDGAPGTRTTGGGRARFTLFLPG